MCLNLLPVRWTEGIVHEDALRMEAKQAQAWNGIDAVIQAHKNRSLLFQYACAG